MSERKRTTPLTPVAITTEECTLDMKRRIIVGLPFLHDVSGRELREVEPIFRELGFAAGQQIDTGAGRGLFVVGAGLVKLVRSDYEGRDVVLDILVTGEFFGRMVGFSEVDVAVAHTAACVFHAGDQQLKRLFQRHPEIAVRLLEMTSARIGRLHERLHLLSGASARDRVVTTLQRLAEKVGVRSAKGILLQVPLSREDLAALSGTSTETASRIISALQREGLLAAGRRWITLRERFLESSGLV